MTLKIVDVASYQGNYNVGSHGEDGVIIKATQGRSYLNPHCDFVAQEAIKQNRPWGLYHYASGDDANQEADFFLGHLHKYLNLKNRPVLILDWEKNENKAYGHGSWVETFMNRVKEKSGVQIGIYVDGEGVQQMTNKVAHEAWLWFAGYPTTKDVGWHPEPFPYHFDKFSILTGWQFSDNPLDKSLFYIDRKGWEALAHKQKL